MSRLLISLLLTLTACGTTEATLEGFDASCDVAEDCTAIFLGDVCGCACDYGAINVAEADAWGEYEADLRDGCDEVLECGPCPDPVITCDDHVCQATMTTE